MRAACHYVPTSPLPHPPHGHLTSSPHTTGFLFQGCFCLVYLGCILPFLWEFVKKEDRAGDLMKSEGMGGVVGWRSNSHGEVILTHQNPRLGRDLHEEGVRVHLGLAHPSASREAPEDPGCEGTAKHLWSIT